MTQPRRRRRWNCCIDDVAVSTFTKRRWWPACALYPMARSRPKFAPSRRPRRTFYVCRSGWRQTSARMWQWRRPASTGSRCGTSWMMGEFELVLANAAHVKNVPGRKTDVNDAMWLAELLAHGLIRASFVPDTQTQEMRNL